ncbi:MAG: hypothetical protein WD638_13380 [Nitriliruptoraceae bacterium]
MAERRLVVGAVATLALLSVPVTAVAWALIGPAAALSALIGLGFVLVLFGASAGLLAWVASREAGSGVWVLTGGVAIRLPLYILALTLLSRVPWVHGRSLAVATAIAIVVTLAAELRLIARTPRLFWVDATATRPSAPANDTRS